MFERQQPPPPRSSASRQVMPGKLRAHRSPPIEEINPRSGISRLVRCMSHLPGRLTHREREVQPFHPGRTVNRLDGGAPAGIILCPARWKRCFTARQNTPCGTPQASGAMSPTLLEGVIAILLVWIAWRIGVLLAPLVIRRFRDGRVQKPPDRKNKPPYIIDT